MTEKEINELINSAIENDVYFECFEGVLRDNYIFYDAESLEIDGQSAKYIILKVVFLNTWSSDVEPIFTDSYEVVQEHEKIFSN